MSHVISKYVIVSGMGLAAFSLLNAPAQAQETTTYSYDALGRLVEVNNSTTAGGNSDIELEYDDAGNRVSTDVTGPASGTPRLRVVPIAGGKTVVVIY